jgi:hypothetical protein
VVEASTTAPARGPVTLARPRSAGAWRTLTTPLRVAALVFVVAAIGLGLGHRASVPAMSRVAAERALRHDPQTAPVVAQAHWSRADVVAIDAGSVHVSLLRGNRLVFSAAVRTDGTVQAWVDARTRVPYGSMIAYRPLLLLGLAAIFILMTAVAPLARIRNLDVAATVALTLPMVLKQHGYPGATMLTAAVALSYLGLRCLCWALADAQASQAPEQAPLYELITRRLSAGERVRVLWMVAIAAGVMFMMVAVTSTGVDVIYAAMEGATSLLHGVLPYGHLTAGDVIHGDTYPILSYALYAPLALATPVTSLFDSVDSALAITVLIAVAGASCAALIVRGARTPTDPDHRAGQLDRLRAGLAVLCFPPLLAIVSSGTTDVAVGAMLALAIALWRRPASSTAVLAVAGWFKLAPAALLGLWLAPLRGRKLRAAARAIAGVSALSAGLVVALGGLSGIGAMVHAVAYQFSRGAYQSLWHTLGIEALQPYAEAGVLALVAGLTVKLATSPGLADDPRRMAGVAAAVLIAVQLAANYWAFLYLAWVAPLIVVSLLAPSKADQPRSRECSETVQIALDTIKS